MPLKKCQTTLFKGLKPPWSSLSRSQPWQTSESPGELWENTDSGSPPKTNYTGTSRGRARGPCNDDSYVSLRSGWGSVLKLEPGCAATESGDLLTFCALMPPPVPALPQTRLEGRGLFVCLLPAQLSSPPPVHGTAVSTQYILDKHFLKQWMSGWRKEACLLRSRL